jgi:large subunit ribosomal protein L18
MLKNRERRIKRVRAKVTGTTERPRLCVYRSLAHINAQVIDDSQHKTLAAARDLDLPAKDRKDKKPVEIANLVGQLVAEKAKAKGVTKVVFDRRDKTYHGRIKAVAEGARLGGLIF